MRRLVLARAVVGGKLSNQRALLGAAEADRVHEGIARLKAINDPALWAAFAEGISLQPGSDFLQLAPGPLRGSVRAAHLDDVLLIVARHAGRLDSRSDLVLFQLEFLQDLRPLSGR